MEIAAKARRAELSLVQPIEDSDDNDRNIGKLAKTTLKRLAAASTGRDLPGRDRHASSARRGHHALSHAWSRALDDAAA